MRQIVRLRPHVRLLRTPLANFSYDEGGVPVSVQVGSDPATAPRSYSVDNGHRNGVRAGVRVDAFCAVV